MPRHHQAERLRAFFNDHRLTGITFHRLLVKAGGMTLTNPDEGRSKVSQWLNGRRGMSERYQRAYELVVLQYLELKLKELKENGAGVALILSTLDRYGYYLGEEATFKALFREFHGLVGASELRAIVVSELKGRMRVELPAGVERALGETPELRPDP